MEVLTNIPNTEPEPDSIDTQYKFGYYAELANASNILDLKNCINAVIKRLGFSEYSYIWLSRSFAYQAELNTLPEKLMTRYYSAGFYEQDMTMQRAMHDTRPFFHSTIYDYVARAPFKSDMTCCMHEIHKLNKEFGYYDFYSIPIKTIQGNSRVMLTVARQGTNPIELKHSVGECESDLLLLCEAIDFVTTQCFQETYCSDDPIKNTIINPKPLRVLDTLANNDLTINQIAEKLCISVVTANQHLKTVRKTLDTHTNYAAIKKAVLKNLIRLEPDKKYNPTPSSKKP